MPATLEGITIENESEAQQAARVISATRQLMGRVDRDSYHPGTTGSMLMYYKKGPKWTQDDDAADEHGYVTVANAHPVNLAQYLKKGMEPLLKYGEFFAVNPDGWDASKEPWRRIFQMDGAAEFPVSQVLAYRWHRKPPYKGITFPQLPEHIEEHVCSYCKRVFLSTLDLQNHETIRHQTTSQQTQLARHLSDANLGVLGPVLEQQQALMAQLVERTAKNEERIASVLEAIASMVSGKGPVLPTRK